MIIGLFLVLNIEPPTTTTISAGAAQGKTSSLGPPRHGGWSGTAPVFAAIPGSRGAADHIAAAPGGSQDTRNSSLKPADFTETQEIPIKIAMSIIP